MASKTDTRDVVKYYDESYCKFQYDMSSPFGHLEVQKFSSFIREQDVVLDFGCGCGFILKLINAKRKIGVEVNHVAAEIAASSGICVFNSLDDIENGSIDVVISNHVLEHVAAPLDIAKKLFDKLKPEGLAVVVVPCERYDMKYNEDNADKHLYTWSPLNIGNLFYYAGFEIIEVKRFVHRIPPFVSNIDAIFGSKICNIICMLYALLRPKMSQVRLIARRPL